MLRSDLRKSRRSEAKMVLALLAFVLAYFAPGYLVSLAAFKRGEVSGLFRLCFSFAASAAILMALMTALGVSIGFSLPLLLAVYAALILVLLVYLCLRKTAFCFEKLELPSVRKNWLLLVPIIISVLAFYHAAAFPETSWDALSYHALFGRLFYEQGNIPAVHESSFINMPHGNQLIYSFFYFFTGFDDLFGRLVSPVFFVFSLGLVYLLARHFANKKVAEYAVIFYSIIPVLVAQSMIMYANLLEAFFGIFAVFLFWLGIQKNQAKYCALSGLMLGAGLLIKFSAGVAVLAILALAIVYKAGWKKVLITALVAGAITAPWFARNMIVVHAPFYPYFSSGANEANIVGFDTAAIRLFFDDRVTYSYGVGPGFLAFGLLGLALFWKKYKQLALWFGISLAAIMLFLRIDSRFYAMLFPLIAFFSALAYDRLAASKDKIVRNIVLCVLVFSALYGLCFAGIGFKLQSFSSDEPAKIVAPVPMSFDDAMSSRFGPLWPAWKYIRDNSASDEAVLAFREQPYYYFRHTYDPRAYLDTANITAAAEKMKQDNVKFVLIEIREYHAGHLTALTPLVEQNLNNSKYFKKVYEQDWVSLYEVV